ncbi:hypothetical protein BSLG_006043 [Batrachochytrium salamandrivorans]|nr:hypothetical protein BSLG_006043 [Batrachochytrium salamandrivorans]
MVESDSVITLINPQVAYEVVNVADPLTVQSVIVASTGMELLLVTILDEVAAAARQGYEDKDRNDAIVKYRTIVNVHEAQFLLDKKPTMTQCLTLPTRPVTFCIAMNSAQYMLVHQVITSLLVYNDPATGKLAERLRKVMLALEQLPDLREMQDMVLSLQERVRQTDSVVKSIQPLILSVNKNFVDPLFKVVMNSIEDQVSINTLEIETLYVENLHVMTSEFKDAISPYIPDRHGVTYELGKQFMRYIFPNKKNIPASSTATTSGDAHSSSPYARTIASVDENDRPRSQTPDTLDTVSVSRRGKQTNEWSSTHTTHSSSATTATAVVAKSSSASTHTRGSGKRRPSRALTELKQMQARASENRSFIYIKLQVYCTA